MEFVHKGIIYSEKNGSLIVEGLDNAKYNGALTIPAIVKKKPVIQIAEDAFMGMEITKAYIPGSILKIGDRAFSHCYNLEVVEENKTVTLNNTGILEIGINAFAACDKLKTIRTHQYLLLNDYSFSNCKRLASIDYVARLNKRSLDGCCNLFYINIADKCDMSAFILKYSSLKKILFAGNAKLSPELIDSLIESNCQIECFSDSNICDLLYLGVNTDVLELPF